MIINDHDNDDQDDDDHDYRDDCIFDDDDGVVAGRSGSRQGG